MSAYPIRPVPADDTRFSFGLTHDLAQLIERAGYPPIASGDFIRLQQALYRFLYGEAS